MDALYVAQGRNLMAGQRLLLCGATNQVGRSVIERCPDGVELTALGRGRQPPWLPTQISWLQHDLGATLNFKPVDALIYAAPLDRVAVALRVLRPGGAAVAFSSMSAISKAGSADPAERDLADRLVTGERVFARLARASQLRSTVLRPTLIYGRGLDTNLTTMAAFIRRWKLLPQLGSAQGLRQPLHAEDAATAAIRAVQTGDGLTHQVFALGGGERLRYRQMTDRVFQALGLRPRYLRLPRLIARLGVAALRELPRYAHLNMTMLERTATDLIADNRAVVRQLQLTPRPFAITPAMLRHAATDGERTQIDAQSLP